MIKVETDNLLANYFAIHSADKVTFPTLKKIKKNLEKKTNYNIIIDLTKKSILNSWRRSPGLFEYHENDSDYPYFERGNEAKTNLDEVNNKYNWELESDTQKIYHEVIKEFGQ